MIKNLLIGTAIAALATIGLLVAKQADSDHRVTTSVAHPEPKNLKETRMTDYTFEFPLQSGEPDAASH